MSEPDGMTRAEDAAALGMSAQTVSNYYPRGRLPGVERVAHGLYGGQGRGGPTSHMRERQEAKDEQERLRRASPIVRARELVEHGDIIDTNEPGRIVGCSPQYVGRLAAAGPFPTCDLGARRADEHQALPAGPVGALACGSCRAGVDAYVRPAERDGAKASSLSEPQASAFEQGVQPSSIGLMASHPVRHM